ncbi:ESPR-type extended signal peptide-containing protein [uncultured Dialister sp.]|uniref:ESPR-type extended signal peptide-containing protein n=1 Tax=uncultured Dialister sp. TaxID=278064 RepID=UPI0025CD8E03|nr:ESPR-type extended signal peptide-containing protein [uncultured Dialister sp.]
MNKIYKVVWSRVKHTYVVASELAKSHTKSETTGTGIGRKLILAAALVCALSAFGSAVPTYGADAGTAGESQYVAVLVNDSNGYYYTSRGRQVSYGDTRTFDGYRYHKETVSGETYWVRDGYTIKYEEDKRYPGARNANIIKAYKTDSYTASSDAGLLKSNQIMVKSSDVSTLTDVILDDVSGGTYVGATNSGNPTTPSSFNYMIKDDNGQYVDAGNTNFSTRFKAAALNADGTYSYNGEVISNDNLYVVNNTVGVFLTSSKNVYTGKVFGANNEVLVTTKGEDGKMYSYWGADTPDPNTTLADMTIGQFNQALEKVNNNSKAVAGDVIKDIRTTSKENGGTIDLVRRGTYNSATGEYEGDYTVGSGITVTSRGGTGGEDVKIHFSAGDNGFDVAAGSKVEAVGTKDAATGIIINGETYNIKTGQDYTAGKNITINGNEISATDTDTTYTAGDNVSISDDNVISAKNTTLAAGKAEKKGNSYIVKDTAGNEVTLEDVASESVVNETINTTKTDLTNVINEKDKLNVKYDNEMKNTVTLGGSDAKNLVKVSNLAAGTADTDAVNVAQLKRSRVELADGLNTSVSYSNDETDGHVIYEVDVNTDGEVKQGDTHIVNGDTVYNALQDVGWTAAVNGETAKEVKKDDTLNFVDGDNISITNDNGNIKISTSGLASSGDIWTAQADGKDVKAVNQKVNFTGSDHIKVTGTDGQVQFEAVGLADTDFTNITEKAVTRITNIAKGEDRHIEAKDYAVDENGTVTMSYVDGNGKAVEGSARITGIAKSDLSNITNEGTTVINTIARNAVKVADGENTTVSKEEADGTTTYKVNVSKAAIQRAVDVKGTDGIAVDSSVDEDGTKNYTVSAKLSGNFKIDEGSGNIDLAPVVKIGDKVTVDGTAGEIKGLTNTTLDAEGFATLGRAATEEQLKAVDEKAAAAKTIVENGKNVEVEKKDNDDGSSTYTVGLAENVTLGDNAITLKGSDGSISAKSGDAALSFDKDGLAVSGTSGITRINGANAYIGKISVVNTADSAIVSGLSNTTTDYEGFADGSGKAATEEQLKEVSGKAGEALETASKGWNLTTNKDEKKKAKVAPDDTVDISGDENIEVDSEGTNVTFGLSDNVKLSVDGSLAVGNSMLTSSYLDVAGYRFLSSSGINANNMRISNVAAGIYDTDAVNVSQLRDAMNSSQISINAGTGIIVEKTGSSYTIKTNIVGLSNENGTVTVSTDSDPTPVTNSNTSTTNRARRMSVMLAANDQVAEESETTTSTGNPLNVKYSANEVTFGTDDGNAASVNDGERIDFKGDGRNITTSSKVEGNYDTITFALNKDIRVDSVTAANVTAANQIAINNGPTMSSNGINMASQKITNLKAGEISETSTDAVNGSQLYATNLAVINNTENINSLSNSISKLDNRIDRVGAGAAALAALHPLDYDPDDKWDFAAGYGNYGSASAVAVGAYYRPNEKTMFSLGGSFGGGENMVNAGVSFKLGSGSNGTSTSKAVMAKKINSLNETIASQEAKLAEQDKKIEDQAVKIEKLEAMINKLLDDKK